jgi:hypothetical protein
MERMMLPILARAERALPALLVSEVGWNSLDVDYDPPRVERLWRPFEECRLYLHRIHPCDRALYHPHPWPSAIKIVSGGYEMGVGFGEGSQPPLVAATLHLKPGSSYEMTNIDGWHYVLPSVENLSIMITGAPWDRWAPGPNKQLSALKGVEVEALLADFRKHYPIV